MTRTIKNIRSVMKLLISIAGVSSGVITFLMALIISYDIFCRLLFNSPTTWVNEITEYFVAFVIFIGACYTSAQNGHISVEFAMEKVSAKVKRAITKISLLISLSYIFILLLQSVSFWRGAYSSGERSWGIVSMPLAIPYTALVIGMLLLLLVKILKLYKKGV